MSAPELKPCPWCNGTNLNCDSRFVWCDDCDVYGPTALYPDTPANVWNTRADIAPAPLPAPDRVGRWGMFDAQYGWIVFVDAKALSEMKGHAGEEWYWLGPLSDAQEKA